VNLGDNLQERLETIRIVGLNLKTMRAYQMKEAYQQVYSAGSSRMFEKLLKRWFCCTTHSRMEPIIKVAWTINRHWKGILNWAQKNISNGIIKDFNSIFQASKAKSRGYKRFDTVRSIIYLLKSKLNFSKINPYYATHSF
jgi:transposase